MNLNKLLLTLLSLLQTTNTPTGTYCGTKTVFGETINGLVNIKSSELLDFSISGDFTISCSDEYYKLDDSNIIMTGINTVGDCLHDTLTDNKITLNSIVYDNQKNQIDVTVKYSIATIDILLTTNCNVQYE